MLTLCWFVENPTNEQDGLTTEIGIDNDTVGMVAIEAIDVSDCTDTISHEYTMTHSQNQKVFCEQSEMRVSLSQLFVPDFIPMVLEEELSGNIR